MRCGPASASRAPSSRWSRRRCCSAVMCGSGWRTICTSSPACSRRATATLVERAVGSSAARRAGGQSRRGRARILGLPARSAGGAGRRRGHREAVAAARTRIAPRGASRAPAPRPVAAADRLQPPVAVRSSWSSGSFIALLVGRRSCPVRCRSSTPSCSSARRRHVRALAADALLGQPPPRAGGLRPRRAPRRAARAADGSLSQVYAGTRSVIEPFRFIPPIAWIPLAIIFFSGLTRFAFLIFLGAFFPIFTSTLVGVARVEPHPPQGRRRARREQVLDPARTWSCRPCCPTSWPACASALGTAWLTIVAAELAGGISTRARPHDDQLRRAAAGAAGDRRHAADRLIGFLMNELLLLIEKRLFRWRWQVTL